MWSKTILHVRARHWSLGVCLSGCGCSGPGAGGGISQPLFSCQGKPSLGLRVNTTPHYPLSSIVWACLDRVIYSIQYLHTWSTAHRAHSKWNLMHQPLRNVAVTLQTERGKATAGFFFYESVYERVISHSAMPLDASRWATSVRIHRRRSWLCS